MNPVSALAGAGLLQLCQHLIEGDDYLALPSELPEVVPDSLLPDWDTKRL
jgi:hypothetical protein